MEEFVTFRLIIQVNSEIQSRIEKSPTMISVFCAQKPGQKAGTCAGDSGGPLLVEPSSGFFQECLIFNILIFPKKLA